MFENVGKLKQALERTLVASPPEKRLDLLLKADRDAEEALLQALQSRLLDLYESLSWAYASAAVRKYQTLRHVPAAANARDTSITARTCVSSGGGEETPVHLDR